MTAIGQHSIRRVNGSHAPTQMW